MFVSHVTARSMTHMFIPANPKKVEFEGWGRGGGGGGGGLDNIHRLVYI